MEIISEYEKSESSLLPHDVLGIGIEINSSPDQIIYDVIRQTKLDAKEEFHIITDKAFFYRNKSLVMLITDSFPKLNKDQVVSLLKFFFIKQLNYREILNLFMMISQVLSHIKYYQSKFFRDRALNETSTERYFSLIQNVDWKYYITSYKTRSNPSNNDTMFYLDDKDRRRRLYLDNREYFNYICLKCTGPNCNFNNDCPLSHNDYELQYHPLFFRIALCRNKDLCKDESCPYSHKDDLRTIFNMNNPRVKRLESLLASILNSNSSHQNSNYDLSSNKISLPAEFHPDSYKTLPCPYGEFCLLDRKLCLNFHSPLEKRRSLSKSKYSSQPCQFACYDNKWKVVTLNECRAGDDCQNSHSIYERMYHPDVYKKSACKFEENNTKCQYVLICPFYHKHDTNINGVIANVNAIVKFHKKNLLKGINIFHEKAKVYKNILSSHQCRICKSLLDGSYNVLNCNTRCIICKECTVRFNQMNKCVSCNTNYSEIEELKIKTK